VVPAERHFFATSREALRDIVNSVTFLSVTVDGVLDCQLDLLLKRTI
jgi:hypothetical protein